MQRTDLTSQSSAADLFAVGTVNPALEAQVLLKRPAETALKAGNGPAIQGQQRIGPGGDFVGKAEGQNVSSAPDASVDLTADARVGAAVGNGLFRGLAREHAWRHLAALCTHRGCSGQARDGAIGQADLRSGRQAQKIGR